MLETEALNPEVNRIRFARVVRGHQVASGGNGDTRFLGGTLRMQTPHFLERGLDIRGCHLGTINVSVAPYRYKLGKPRHTFADVRWHPTEPAETFSFIDCTVAMEGGEEVAGWIYFPHPETKPEHFQQPDVLELLLPFLPGVRYGSELILTVPVEQMRFLRPEEDADS